MKNKILFLIGICINNILIMSICYNCHKDIKKNQIKTIEISQEDLQNYYLSILPQISKNLNLK